MSSSPLPLPPDDHGQPRALRMGEGDEWLLDCAAGELVLPPSAIPAIFRRYGRPLDEQHELVGPALALEDGARLCAESWRGPFDVIANDWFVLVTPGNDRDQREGRSAVPAPLFVAALVALGRPR